MTDLEKLTEDKIFESATEVFLVKGMDGARMQDIADHAGINKSLLHYYYRTKDHLFNVVFEKMATQMFKSFAPVLDENLTLEEKIRFFFREHISLLQRNPRLASFIINEMNRNPQRIKKLVQNLDLNRIWNILEQQHREEFIRYNITREVVPQLFSSIAALSVFPFAAKAIISGIMEKMGYNFDEYIETRKTFAADFVIKAITK